MKVYAVLLLQFMIWSGFTLIEWLSKHDHPIYNGIMFFVFFYLAIIIGNQIMKSTRKTFFITLLSLVIYVSIHMTMSFISSI
ncbi:hypothetical protein GWK17_08085 [Bacillus selenatarsenatis]|uniref:Uncharacterized protein n=1 Tax=Mesobacillus selenatarsenatis TaxID=388741 RepID=A0A846TUJ2_9BACI|nr:hypothetical protein [Mesobacillus selenatarsenatis]NKE05436.1 hypothetical protein [Mesobacillus selenatarsenatis]